MTYRLSQLADAVEITEGRPTDETWMKTRGRTVSDLIEATNDPDRNTPAEYTLEDIAAARLLTWGVEAGYQGKTLRHLDAMARAEMQRGARKISLAAAVADLDSDWVFEIIRYFNPQTGERNVTGYWVVDGFRFGKPDPESAEFDLGDTLESVERFHFTRVWRPIAAELAKLG